MPGITIREVIVQHISSRHPPPSNVATKYCHLQENFTQQEANDEKPTKEYNKNLKKAIVYYLPKLPVHPLTSAVVVFSLCPPSLVAFCCNCAAVKIHF